MISFIKTALFGLLLTGLYHSAFTNMIRRWDRPEYNYCYLIPLVVAYLIWEKRTKLAELASLPSWKGMIPLVFGLMLFWLGELGGEYFTLYISFWLVVVGLLWIHLGWQKIRTIAFALFMTLTMFPLPNFLYNKISVKLQLISSKLGVSLMHLYGMSAHREGNVIDLGFAQLQVVDACSGLRSLMSLTILGLLMAYFFRASFWKRALLLSSTVPLSVLANSMRLALTGFLYETYGCEAAEGFFHGFSGWVIFILVFGILLLEMCILKKIFPEGEAESLRLKAQSKDESEEDKAAESSKLPGETGFPFHRAGKTQSSKGLLAFVRPPQFIAALILLGATLAFSQGINFREKIPIITSFNQFPLQVGEWTGTRQSMEQRFVGALDFSDYAIIDYRNRTGEIVNFYVAYYENQRKGESIHTPATCLPGSGWLFREAGATTFSTPGYNAGSMRVNRAYMEKLGSKQLSYYWFPQRGRILSNAYQLKVFAFWDALARQRTDGALVRLITPVSGSEKLDRADARLQAFARLIVPVLAEYVPGKDLGIGELGN